MAATRASTQRPVIVKKFQAESNDSPFRYGVTQFETAPPQLLKPVKERVELDTLQPMKGLSSIPQSPREKKYPFEFEHPSGGKLVSHRIQRNIHVSSGLMMMNDRPLPAQALPNQLSQIEYEQLKQASAHSQLGSPINGASPTFLSPITYNVMNQPYLHPTPAISVRQHRIFSNK